MRYDVIIVGAGPAGAVLAWKLPQSMKVLVVDSRPLLDESRIHAEDKCCGGMLDHASQKALARLGLGLPKRVQMAPQIFTVRAIDFDSHTERYYQRNYLNIDRAEFDRWLLSLAEKRPNVTIRTEEKAIILKEEKDTVFLTTRKGQEQFTYEGRFLAGADGAASFVRHYLTRKYRLKRKEPRVYASIQEWHPVKTPPPYYGAMFDRKVTDYYSWIIPKTIGKGEKLAPGGYILLGSAIPAEKLTERNAGKNAGKIDEKNPGKPAGKKNASVGERFEQLRKDMLSKGFEVSSPAKRQGALILRPRMFGSVFDGMGQVFLCGEAAGLISPSSSEGISFALSSAEALADSFAKACAVSSDSCADAKALAAGTRREYQKRILPLKLSIALKTLKSPVMYQPLPRRMVFLTRALSMKVRRNTEKWED